MDWIRGQLLLRVLVVVPGQDQLQGLGQPGWVKVGGR